MIVDILTIYMVKTTNFKKFFKNTISCANASFTSHRITKFPLISLEKKIVLDIQGTRSSTTGLLRFTDERAAIPSQRIGESSPHRSIERLIKKCGIQFEKTL